VSKLERPEGVAGGAERLSYHESNGGWSGGRDDLALCGQFFPFGLPLFQGVREISAAGFRGGR
jgi:hypothetical protein